MLKKEQFLGQFELSVDMGRIVLPDFFSELSEVYWCCLEEDGSKWMRISKYPVCENSVAGIVIEKGVAVIEYGGVLSLPPAFKGYLEQMEAKTVVLAGAGEWAELFIDKDLHYDMDYSLLK